MSRSKKKRQKRAWEAEMRFREQNPELHERRMTYKVVMSSLYGKFGERKGE